MTDPEMADRTYIEPLTWEIVAKVIEAERPDALLPTLGGQTGLNLAMDLHHHGVLRKIRRRDDRRHRRGDRKGRIPRPVQGGHGADRPGGVPRPDGRQPGGSPADGAGDRSALRGAAQFHPRRHRFEHRLQPQYVRRAGAARAGSLARPPGAAGRIGDRLERVRDGGDARQGRQLRHHLLDRELRSDGRAHGRFDHRGPGADLDRQGISADARRLDRRDAGDRRGDGRLEHPVRHQSADRAAWW